MTDAFAARLARLRAVLRDADCPVMLADHAELLAWATGYTVSETRYRAAILPAEGDPCFVLRALDEGPCRDGIWFDDVAAYDDEADPHAAVAAALTARGFGAARIGVDANSYGFTAATATRLQALLPEARFVDLGPVSDSLRWVKFADELALIRRAAAVADGAMRALALGVRPGQRVRDAVAVAAAAVLALGADDGDPGPILRAAGDVDFLHGRGLDAVLALGDVLHAELTPKVGRYGARLMRPILVGANPAKAAAARRLFALQDAQIAAMQPGAEAAAVDAVLRRAVLAVGLRPDYRNVTGYTLGIYARTPRPSDFSLCFHPGARFRLEPGMVFHMYASAQGVAVSETVLVAEDGPQRLTRLERAPLTAGAG